MKNIISIFLLILISNNIQAQNACEFDSIYNSTKEKGFKIVETSNSKTYASVINGYTESGSDQNLILKLYLIDSCGALIWSKKVDSLQTVGFSTIIDLIQRKNGTLLCATENLASGAKIKGIQIFNIDSNGNLLWKSRFDSSINTNADLTCALEIGINSYLLAGSKNNRAYFLIGDTSANLISQKSFFILDSTKTSLIQSIYNMGNNSFAILGIEDSIAFIKYIDSVGNILSEILISKISSNKIINRIDFNFNKTKIILNGLTNDNKGFVSEYNLNGSLIKNIVLQGLPNDIRQCAPNSYIMFDLGKVLTLGSKWIKVDSNYQIISSYPIKDVSSQGYSVKYVMNISNSFSNFYGIGRYVLGSGFNAKTSLFIKKIRIIDRVASINISGTSTINTLGGILLLNANILPATANNKQVLWSINDTNLANITQTGLVTAKANGTVIVTATAADGGGAKTTKTIAISNQNIIIQSITIIGNDSIIIRNGFNQLSTQVLPNNATNKQVIWSISDTNLAFITQTGLVTVKANGTVIVTATAADGGGAKATKNITISSQNINIQYITINGNDSIIIRNGFNQLSTQVLPNNATNKQVIWSINDTSLATITQTGLVTAKANGTVIVTATAADGSGAKATKTITISNQNINIQSITINGNDSIIIRNGFNQLSTQVLPNNATNKQVIWSISDTNLATISQTGMLTAKANGTVIVTATAADGGGAKATKTITISNQNVGLNDINLTNQITVYPNPSGNFVTITTNNNLTIQQLQLLDITGKVIAQFSNQTEIDLSNIANGVYLINIQTEKGNLVKQVVVNR